MFIFQQAAYAPAPNEGAKSSDFKSLPADAWSKASADFKECAVKLEYLKHVRNSIPWNPGNYQNLNKLTDMINSTAEILKNPEKFAKEIQQKYNVSNASQGVMAILDSNLSIIRQAMFGVFDKTCQQGEYTISGKGFIGTDKTVSAQEATSKYLNSLVFGKGESGLDRQFVSDYFQWKVTVVKASVDDFLRNFKGFESTGEYKDFIVQHGKCYYSAYSSGDMSKFSQSTIENNISEIFDLQQKAALLCSSTIDRNTNSELLGGVTINEHTRKEIAGWLDLAVTVGAVTMQLYTGAKAGKAPSPMAARQKETWEAVSKLWFTSKGIEQARQGDIMGAGILFTALYAAPLSNMYKGLNPSAKLVSSALGTAGFASGAYLSVDMVGNMVVSAQNLNSPEKIRSFIECGFFTIVGAKGAFEGAKAVKSKTHLPKIIRPSEKSQSVENSSPVEKSPPVQVETKKTEFPAEVAEASKSSFVMPKGVLSFQIIPGLASLIYSSGSIFSKTPMAEKGAPKPSQPMVGESASKSEGIGKIQFKPAVEIGAKPETKFDFRKSVNEEGKMFNTIELRFESDAKSKKITLSDESLAMFNRLPVEIQESSLKSPLGLGNISDPIYGGEMVRLLENINSTNPEVAKVISPVIGHYFNFVYMNVSGYLYMKDPATRFAIATKVATFIGQKIAVDPAEFKANRQEFRDKLYPQIFGILDNVKSPEGSKSVKTAAQEKPDNIFLKVGFDGIISYWSQPASYLGMTIGDYVATKPWERTESK